MQVLFATLFVTQLLCTTLACELKVGLYNQIPDLGGDGLESYKKMVENGFIKISNKQHTVNAVVDENGYNPYGNLENYLDIDSGYDVIEIDTATLGGLVENNLVLVLPEPPAADTLPAARDSVTINGQLYGYPTLLCGNFLIDFGKKETCDGLVSAQSSYKNFERVMKECRNKQSYKRVVGGKMNSKGGWYLPFIYLDGYIDVHGPASVAKAVDEVTRGVIDPVVCTRLTWFIEQCSASDKKDSANKCYQDFEGSYVEDQKNIYADIKNKETMLLFGFSELVGELGKDPKTTPHAAISAPMGESNHLLLFTDALVINKARWDIASEEKKNAILQFCKYFTQKDLRVKISLGKDLEPQYNRYLLHASETFYSDPDVANHAIYEHAYWSLKTAVPVPSLSGYQRGRMQSVLSDECVKLSPAIDTKIKEEL